MLGRLTTVAAERATFDESLAENVRFADQVATTLTALADDFIAKHDIQAPAPESDPDTGPLESTSASELDLAAAGVSTVIWCTGFTGDLSWVRLPILDDAGSPRGHRCSTAVPGLWLIGVPWLTRRRSSILYGFPDDADEVARGICQQMVQQSKGPS